MDISNSDLIEDEQFQYATGNSGWWSNLWESGETTDTDAALAALAAKGTTADSTIDSGDRNTANDGRRNADGSSRWKDIFLAGADVIQQFGNQSPDRDGLEDDWNDELDDDDDRYKVETKILGMHPLTFGVVALSTVIVGGIVIYQVTKKR